MFPVIYAVLWEKQAAVVKVATSGSADVVLRGSERTCEVFNIQPSLIRSQHPLLHPVPVYLDSMTLNASSRFARPTISLSYPGSSLIAMDQVTYAVSCGKQLAPGFCENTVPHRTNAASIAAITFFLHIALLLCLLMSMCVYKLWRVLPRCYSLPRNNAGKGLSLERHLAMSTPNMLIAHLNLVIAVLIVVRAIIYIAIEANLLR